MGVGPAGDVITIHLPAGLPGEIAPTAEAFEGEFRLAAAIEWYRQGRITQGRGAEVAGLSRADFLDALARAKVPASQYESVDELMEEVDRVVEAHRRRFPADPAGQGGSA